MKKTLLFAGITALCVSNGAFAFSDSSATYPGFTDNNTTHRYATKHTGDGTGPIKITHATTNYVTARAGEARVLVDTLTDRADDDDGVIADNTEALSGIQDATPSTWAEKGMDTNRQVKTTAANNECANLNNEYSGCGYIVRDAGSVPSANNYSGYSQTSSDYQWVKIRTNCGVEGQSNAPNCVSNTGV